MGDVNAALKAAAKDSMKGIINHEELPLMTSEFKQSDHARLGMPRRPWRWSHCGYQALSESHSWSVDGRCKTMGWHALVGQRQAHCQSGALGGHPFSTAGLQLRR